ncbi:hypothetical protein ACO0LG_16595 [Undibacterium sp. Ji42W]|uniref:hypothetical protein n=1 Tax=Undibacterium sp. Ji42W TaxID=3413039 RepID=UPI003BF1F09F
MQRLYSMFPAGRAGAGLLILRIVVALQLPAASACCGVTTLAWWVDKLVVGLVVLLCIGILTPLLALLCVVEAGICLLSQDMQGMQWQFVLPVIAIVMANAIALALLGPGAYSLDAKFFGRRLIVLSDTRP